MQKRLRQKDISQRNKNDVAKTIFMNDKGGLKNGNDDDAEDFGLLTQDWILWKQGS